MVRMGPVLNFVQGAAVAADVTSAGEVEKVRNENSWLLLRAGAALAVVILLVPSWGCRELGRALGSAGSACTTDANCPTGLTCLTDAEGFPGGYCSQQLCDIADAASCPGLFASCVYLDRANNVTACIETCVSDGDCRVREGYICTDLDPECALGDQQTCARGCFPSSIAQTSAGSIGSACGTDTDCNDGLTCLTNFVFGYCSAECVSDAECGDDGRCVDQGGGVLRCMDACESNRQCRFAYSCADPDGGGGVCDLDQGTTAVRNPAGAEDGAPCVNDISCKGGVCITGEDFPEGYCSTRDCGVVGCASETSTCVQLQRESFCFAPCGVSTDCREGYSCTALETGGQVCYSKPPASAPPADDPNNASVDIRCDTTQLTGGLRQARFTIGAGTLGFAVVPFSPAQNEVEPVSMTLPNGQNFDFNTQYSFQTINSLLLGVISPMFFPAAPQFESTLVMPGEYTFEFRSIDAGACYYVVEQTALGSTIDLNFYFVGVPNLNAASAENNSDFQAVLSEFSRIYQNAGINVGTVRVADITGDNLQRYQIVRDFGDIYRLISLSQSPGPTLDEALSVNVFLIKGFNISEIPGLLGLSAGIPGVPAVHGNGGAGLVFTTENLTFDPASLGQTMAHEVGHFLGLRHTSERGGSAFDPINDTPTCGDPEDAYSCPDLNNLMFPFSIDVDQRGITAGQRFVLQRNPLVK